PKRALSSTVASGTERKHVTLSIKDKVNLIKKLESGTAVAKLCEEYGLGKSTIYDIKKQKKKNFLTFLPTRIHQWRWVKERSFAMQKTMIMTKGVRQQRSEGVPLSGPLLMEQAKIFHRSMNLTTDYSYTTGWLTKFKKRRGIRQLKICGDKASADAEAAEDFVNEFVSLVETEKLSPEQIYIADETGLFWRYVPRSTLATADEKDATGVKDSKERITILGCGNAAGSHKTKLFVIGKSAKPRAFKNVKVFPVK
ncbi:Tigger transposable element-derived protein 2, partial [Araneus ventricosus]